MADLVVTAVLTGALRWRGLEAPHVHAGDDLAHSGRCPAQECEPKIMLLREALRLALAGLGESS
jgi:hypothetical protein